MAVTLAAGASAGDGPKLGLYSITYLGIWYKGGALSLVDFIKQAKKLGYSGVEIDGKRVYRRVRVTAGKLTWVEFRP